MKNHAIAQSITNSKLASSLLCWAYVKRWIAEGYGTPSDTALAYFDAIPRSWSMSAGDAYPSPVVEPDAGRKIALDAYENRGF